MPEIEVFIDMMGGDKGPGAVVEGIKEARHLLGSTVRLIAVGQQEYKYLLGGRYVDDYLPVEGVVGMNDNPNRAFERNPTTSVGLAVLKAAGQNNAAAVSFGNSGAAHAAARRHMGALVERPKCRAAIAAVLPTFNGRQTVFLDAGANPDLRAIRPIDYLDWSLMGAVYAHHLDPELEFPKIGLISYGTEPNKGPAALRAALDLLQSCELTRTMVKNEFAEGGDLMRGRYAVLVAGGFEGNVMLKEAEWLLTGLFTQLKREFQASLPTRIAGMLIKSRLKRLRAEFGWRRYNGALLLGVDGNIVIAHGNSDDEAAAKAICIAANIARDDASGQSLLEQMRLALSAARAAGHYSDAASVEEVSEEG